MTTSELIKKHSDQIWINWVSDELVCSLLIKYKIDPKIFLSKYWYQIIEYIVWVFKWTNKIWECKIRAKFLNFLQNHNVEINDLYVIYLVLKKVVTNQVSKSKLSNAHLLDTLESFFNSNFEWVIKQYAIIYFSKLSKTSDLEKSHKKLKAFDKMKDRFLWITSHEMRTPLTVIKWYSSLMLEWSFWKLTAKQIGFVNKIYNNAWSLILLVDSMLDVTKLKSWKIDLDIWLVDTNAMINSLVKELSLIYKNKNLKILFENKNKINLKIQTDWEKLKQVFINLLNNACKFTAKNWNVKIVASKCGNNDDLIMFSVIDTWIWIDKNKIKTIFNEFYQIDNYLQREYEWSWLGLMIAKNIVKNLKWKIWVESVQWEWTNFMFTIKTNL